MKFIQGLLLLLTTVISDCVCLEDLTDTRLQRDKRQSGPWVWGENAGKLTRDDNRNVNLGISTTEKPNPCSPFVSNKPDFSKQYRISEAKCFEYIWELKNRDDIKKHKKLCADFRAQANPNTGVFHASGVGGRNTLPGEFPHMGALGWRAVVGTWLFMCGSSLISSKFLLTAAHCSQISSADTRVTDSKPEIVRLGDKNIVDNNYLNGQIPVDKEILRFIVHPQYKPPKKYFDIALVELTSEVNFDRFIQPACLWTKDDTSPLGTEAAVTGWGTVDAAKQTTSPELQAVFLDVIDSNTCNNLLKPAFNRHFNGIQRHQLCAGVLTGGHDACQGDSGGPLQVKISLPIRTEGTMSYVIGVTSFGVGCARANLPGVYTRVSSFIPWIESVVWK